MIFLGYLIFMGLIILPALDYFLGLLVFPTIKPSNSIDSVSPRAMDGVSAIIACHNEVVHIEQKVYELITQFTDAKVQKYEIIVVSDGSDDGSNDVLERLAKSETIIYHLIPERQGKPNAINKGVSLSKYPLLLFSDVRQTFTNGAISHLLSNLSDPEVGAVTSQLELEGDASPSRKLMNKLKLRESMKGSTTGMCGALYVIRKNLVTTLPTDIILDDLIIALSVMSQDKRVVLEPRAIVHDVSWDLFYSGRRQGRITAGLVQLLKQHRPLIFSIGLKQLVFLYGQKFMKYTVPILFTAASFLVLFISHIRAWHFGITLLIFMILVIWRPRFIGETLRLVLSYMSQLLKLDKYKKIKWER
ncbi:MAG TPA: glycosyltransferase [Flavobacteriales bacterium]|nr:glycosyltransferase [Flavobacteriales bacterium]HIB76952.1 glycosyltransferase [Flavobacteriales bacterium]HIN41743.1 glycosyltransferase [Flavobacteriales bacterium]HIO16114.1 glycosyltransferase [Flavobacteriales bacterium]HIO59408.1 glycosyltransferase [Flavobacteriales bacterium]